MDEQAQDYRPWKYKVDLARTASGKDTVEVRVYGDDLEVAAREAMEMRARLLQELGQEV